MPDDTPNHDTRSAGGSAEEPLMISKAEMIAEIEALPESATCGSYATESPKGGGKTDWPRDYACD